jgi:hypothetical protein
VSSWSARGQIHLIYVDSLYSKIELSGSVGRTDGPINITVRVDRIHRFGLTLLIK